MTLLQLYNKCQNSGIDGEPVISNQELQELRQKLSEMAEFLKSYNLARRGVHFYLEGVENMIDARDLN